MIIGLSGKIGSGKNLVASMINELTNNQFEEKAFAGKLKDIVCLLINCTRKQLEDKEFKETALGKEWDWGGQGHGPQLTPRLLLQLIGTECGRQVIHPNIWVNALMSDYKLFPDPSIRITNTGHPATSVKEAFEIMYPDNHIYPDWIITDVRFLNEAEAIKEKGGIIIRLNRIQSFMENKARDMKNGNYEPHASEIALDDYLGFNYVVDNDSDIPSLVEKIKQILILEGIL